LAFTRFGSRALRAQLATARQELAQIDTEVATRKQQARIANESR
jgi:hypothetical protein